MNDTIPALAQFIEPSPVKFAPDAPGWYVLCGVLILSLLLVAFLIYRKYKRNRYRREAIGWLEQMEKQLVGNHEYARIVYTADMLAKQISIQVYGREATAALRGSEWIDYLNKSNSSVSFSETDEHLLQSVYEKEVEISETQAMGFTTKIKQWIKKHQNKQ